MGRDAVLLELCKLKGNSCPTVYSINIVAVFATAWNHAREGLFCVCAEGLPGESSFL